MAVKRSQIAKATEKESDCCMVLAGTGLGTRAGSKVSLQEHVATDRGIEFFS